ncbi:MAG: hypothetical protein L0271_17035 [Gemmatimonadetes bacterium]|nr:hypothetical protein [Gemmatimonadota bacterium]
MQSHQRVTSALPGLLTLTLVLALQPGAAQAQRVLDLPPRTTAGPDAILRGPIAVFWNPAGIGIDTGRGEAAIVDLRGPSITGLGAFGLAATWNLDERTALAAGYQHIGIDGIEETTTSPLPPSGGASLIDISENIFAIAASRRAGARATIGAGVQYVRGAGITGGENVVGIGAGAEVRPELPLEPQLGAAVNVDDEGTTWTGAVEISPIRPRGDWSLHAAWGAGGSPRFHGVSHRAAARADWSDRIAVAAGVSGEPGADGRTWDPLASISLRITRYTVSVMREELPNGFGAVHALRLSVRF